MRSGSHSGSFFEQGFKGLGKMKSGSFSAAKGFGKVNSEDRAYEKKDGKSSPTFPNPSKKQNLDDTQPVWEDGEEITLRQTIHAELPLAV